MKRNLENKIVLGVCAGIADATGIDVTIVRLLYVIGMFVTGIIPGLVLYVVLALLMK